MPLPRPVWLLGWVSFFTDTASEMIYPLMPLFLTRVLGAGPMSLGVIEGIAEAANSILKIVSGRMADRTGAPKPLVLAGYGLSSIVRPFIAMAGGWLQVLALRFADRLGKGIRSSPRDAMLATFATESNRGQIFGFHRGMDHAGAVMGPLIAAAFLYFRPDDYRTLFALTIVPGIIVILILLRIPDTRREHRHSLPTSHRSPTAPGRRHPGTSACRALSGMRWRSSSSSASATPATRSCCCVSPTSASRRSGFRCSGPPSTSSRPHRP